MSLPQRLFIPNKTPMILVLPLMEECRLTWVRRELKRSKILLPVVLSAKSEQVLHGFRCLMLVVFHLWFVGCRRRREMKWFELW